MASLYNFKWLLPMSCRLNRSLRSIWGRTQYLQLEIKCKKRLTQACIILLQLGVPACQNFAWLIKFRKGFKLLLKAQKKWYLEVHFRHPKLSNWLQCLLIIALSEITGPPLPPISTILSRVETWDRTLSCIELSLNWLKLRGLHLRLH